MDYQRQLFALACTEARRFNKLLPMAKRVCSEWLEVILLTCPKQDAPSGISLRSTTAAMPKRIVRDRVLRLERAVPLETDD